MSARTSAQVAAGAWTQPPIIVSDGHARLAICVQGSETTTVFVADVTGRTTQTGALLTTATIDAGDFDEAFGESSGFAPLQWRVKR